MFSAHFVAMALATLVGLSLGALGSGGSIMTTPLLVYVAHIPAKTAVAMSLVIVGSTSLIGAILQVRRGNFAMKPVVLFAMTGMIGSFYGSSVTRFLSQRSLMLILATIMLLVGAAMWRGSIIRTKTRMFCSYRCLIAGFAVGLLTGFLGVGGGFLIVPALVLFAGLEARVAAGTSLAVIAFNCAIGLVGQLRFIDLDWNLLAGFLVFTISGMVIGVTVCTRLPDVRIRRVFSIVMFVLAGAIVFTNLA
jgi:uncharacterized membrane protein YfcA